MSRRGSDDFERSDLKNTIGLKKRNKKNAEEQETILKGRRKKFKYILREVFFFLI